GLGDLADESESLSGDRPEQPLLLAGVTDGLADGVDVTGECRGRDHSPAPDRGQEVVPADHPLAVLQEIDQQVEDLWPRGNDSSSTGEFPPVQVEHAVAENEPHSVLPRPVFEGQPYSLDGEPAQIQEDSKPPTRSRLPLGGIFRGVDGSGATKPAEEQAMKIVVTGGSGLIGTKLVSRLRRCGHEVVAASLDTGVNISTREGLARLVEGAEVLVDVANSPSFEDRAALEFFRTAGGNLLAAERSAEVRHHLTLSVVGSDRLADSGYLRAKLVQERLVETSGIPYTILRSTQFFEFIGAIIGSA